MNCDSTSQKNQGSRTTKCEPNSISDHDSDTTDKFCTLIGDQEQQQQRQQFNHYQQQQQQQLANGFNGSCGGAGEDQSARLAIYHNSYQNGIELQDQRPLLTSKSTATTTTTTTTDKVNGCNKKIVDSTLISNSPYDFLIIDQPHHHHALSPDSQATSSGCDSRLHHNHQAAAVLLLDSDSAGSRGYTCNSHHLHCNSQHSCDCLAQVEPSAFATHIQLMPPSLQHYGAANDNGATLRRHRENADDDDDDHLKQHLRELSSSNGLEVDDDVQDNNCRTALLAPDLTNSDARCISQSYRHQQRLPLAVGEYFDVRTEMAPSMSDNNRTSSCSIIRSPVGLLPLAAAAAASATAAAASQTTSPAMGGFNFELNSQGEITVTDESSSFIHDDGSGNGSDHQYVMCYACRRSDGNHSHHHQPTASSPIHHQASQIFLQSCSECHRLNHDLNHVNFDAGTYVLSPPHCETAPASTCSSHGHSPTKATTMTPIAMTTPSQSSILQASSSTLKRKVPSTNSRSFNDRVRFVDIDLEHNR